MVAMTAMLFVSQLEDRILSQMGVWNLFILVFITVTMRLEPRFGNDLVAHEFVHFLGLLAGLEAIKGG